jgi:NTP pyrophosphatase (non-canonical NTP hydrolase)
MDLRTYQERAQRSDRLPLALEGQPTSASILVPLLGLAGEVGELVSEYKKYLRDGDSHRLFKERVAEELGDLLWYLANVAAKFGLDLDEVAEANLAKCADRWSSGANTDSAVRPALDEGYPETERLPRRFEVEVTTVDGSGTPQGSVIMRAFVDGARLGDDLTDNSYDDDGFRFHDVFHLSYAAVLGWSPITRALMRRKRKSNPKVDEVEDGGRAKVIEEGISAMVFSYAERHNFLEGAEAVSYDLLRTIKGMTKHLEVARCSAAEWERAIMAGFAVWRAIRGQGAGRLEVDLDRRTITLVKGDAAQASRSAEVAPAS